MRIQITHGDLDKTTAQVMSPVQVPRHLQNNKAMTMTPERQAQTKAVGTLMNNS